jgi:hypothetical protein
MTASDLTKRDDSDDSGDYFDKKANIHVKLMSYASTKRTTFVEPEVMFLEYIDESIDVLHNSVQHYNRLIW